MNLKYRPIQPLSAFAQSVAEAVAIAWFPLTVAEIIGGGRSRWIAEARGVFCLVLKTHHVPTTTISGYTGRGISAVDHAIRSARNLVATDPETCGRYQSVMDRTRIYVN